MTSLDIIVLATAVQAEILAIWLCCVLTKNEIFLTERRLIAIARNSKKWSFYKIFFYFCLWKIYRLLPGKGDTEFNIPGPTSKSHPFGWIEPFYPEETRDYEL